MLTKQIYYYTECLEQSQEYILDSKDYFNINQREGFVDTMLTKCIEKYTSLRKENYNNQEELKNLMNPKLENIVNSMFKESQGTRQDLKICAGIAIECRRLDIIQEIVNTTSDLSSIQDSITDLSQRNIQNKQFRDELLELVLKAYVE